MGELLHAAVEPLATHYWRTVTAETEPPVYTWIHSTITGHTGRVIIHIRPYTGMFLFHTAFHCFCSACIWFIRLSLALYSACTTHNFCDYLTTTPSNNFFIMYLCSSVLLSTILRFYSFNFITFNDMTYFNLISHDIVISNTLPVITSPLSICIL
jgi:hypothetical protein